MGDAEVAWEKWHQWNSQPKNGWPDDGYTCNGFMAGFAAGQVAALTDAAETIGDDWCREELLARAAEVGGETDG